MTPDSPFVDDVVPSPNHGERRHGLTVSMLVLHYTGMPDDDAALRWLCTPAAQVSSHYLIHTDGRIAQLVPEARRAWHAGAGSWRGRDDVNSLSIGIEIGNPGHGHGYRPFPEAQIAAVIRLCRDVVRRLDVAPADVIAHSDMAPRRKQDPGELFPWHQLHAAGIGHWLPAARIGGGRFLAAGDRGQPVEALQSMLAFYGYPVPVTGDFDEDTAFAVTAFQRHFRQERVDGIADASTITTLRDLIGAERRTGSDVERSDEDQFAR